MKTKHLVFVALFAALIAVGAQIRVPIGPVPFTLQMPMVLLTALILGSKLGALSTLVYMLVGLIGVPVFAGSGGIGALLSPSFGFVLGFIPAAYIAGIGVREGQPLHQSLIYTYLALIVTFIFGIVYFTFIMNTVIGTPVGLIEALMVTVVPFIIKDLIVGTLTVMFARVLKARGILRIAH
ncbi:biotin transporter BioY [Salinicoccus halitifaciens]|uniref:Biotin transporter n=1 Tax=Salinicoccus halitifaciens TaxID=1073415 RepID=A0ABV2ECW4_9STAP|nr:biotin transporter BioY [Salinicoccus halitifaciens]MCD2138643.1 biotin transporter BioY [Salinicoccus halitifaciens]